MSKRKQIIDALQSLIIDGKGNTCSVSDIAKQAEIGKGTIYYYFKSKEEIFDALVDRFYTEVITSCHEVVEASHLPAIQKMALLFKQYFSYSSQSNVDRYLHEPQNAYIHQKSLAQILTQMTPILAGIIDQGIEEGTFSCSYPKELAEMILSEFCFVFDPGIFTWTEEQALQKKKALSEFMEKSLSAPTHSFSFLYLL